MSNLTKKYLSNEDKCKIGENVIGNLYPKAAELIFGELVRIKPKSEFPPRFGIKQKDGKIAYAMSIFRQHVL